MPESITLFWFRRDLRLEDNTGLFQALNRHKNVQPIFIFDTDILEKLEDKSDKRVSFIYERIERLKLELEAIGSTLWVFSGKPIEIFQKIIDQHQIVALFANRDYEPYARTRDESIFNFLSSKGIDFKAFKDHVIFDKNEIVKADGTPYTVYTPYSKRWKAQLHELELNSFDIENLKPNFRQTASEPLIPIAVIGFIRSNHGVDQPIVDKGLISTYHATRDLPALRGTSRLSVHLRFGTISIRSLVKTALETNDKWLNELIWRDFYQSILWHFPHVEKRAFKKPYDFILWRNNTEEFRAWCDGKTGYPIVDAGMRELNQTGFMHNRVRMIVASFLTKHLLIDWRWGEAYFAQNLLDFDLASNNGGWQWAASSGVDATPYFRIFNPYLQTERFDSKLKYVKKWIPELDTASYPKPIVDHKLARIRALDVYKTSLQSTK